MKKKNLKSLTLNKKVVSNFEQSNVVGAGTLTPCNPNSQFGCTGTPDQTMTCANWSCTCPSIWEYCAPQQ